MHQLEIDVLLPSELDDAYIVEVAGELHSENLKELSKKVDPLLGEGKKSILIFNFGNLHFVDSVVIGYLIQVIRKATEDSKQTVVFSEVKENVLEILQLVGVDQIAKFYANNEEAINAFQG